MSLTRVKEFISLVRDTLQIIYYLSYTKALFAALLLTIGGVVAAFFRLETNLILLIFGLALTIMLSYLIKRSDNEKKTTLRNPNIVIELDRVTTLVSKKFRRMHRCVTLKAKRPTERYCFKVFWTGSMEGNTVSCDQADGYIAQTVFLPGTRAQWVLYELVFHTPMKAGDTRTINLYYHMLDPKAESEPYQFVSYAHVLACQKLEFTLKFEATFMPTAVYLIHRDENEVPLLKRELSYNKNLEGYIIHENIKPRVKYTIEWKQGSAEVPAYEPSKATSVSDAV